MEVRCQVPAPSLFRLAAHPVRWRLLSELAYSDRQVRELTTLVGKPQSLVSYHLGQLRAGRLVSTRRSSADGRDAYYSLDLARCGELLAEAGGALHPGLSLGPPLAELGAGSERRTRVLFLCTGNSTRSQLAEALLRHLAGDTVEVASAGSHPKPVHPNAVRVMQERGIDPAGSRSKHLGDFTRRRFDYVITLCDKVREVCPEFPGARRIHWSIPDPALEGDTVEETYPAFQRTASEIETRVRFLAHTIGQQPARR